MAPPTKTRARRSWRLLLLLVAVGQWKAWQPASFALPDCVRVEDLNMEILLSKVLSVAVIAGSFLGKMPQVFTVYRAKSAQGLSKISIWTEAVSMGTQLAYNIVRRTPLTTYAEIAVLFPQMILLTVVVAWADGTLGRRVGLAIATLCTGVFLMATGWVSATVTAAAYAANAMFGIVAVLPQVAVNYRNKSTGQLSFLVTAMTFGGIGARLFTTFVEVDDLALRLTMLVNFSLVSMLMTQFALYRDTRPLPAKPPPETLYDESPVEESPASEVTFRRQSSMFQAFASFGSSRCLSEMVDVEMMEKNVEVMKARSSASLTTFARSISWSSPPASNSAPDLAADLDSLDLRQASAPSPPLRRN